MTLEPDPNAPDDDTVHEPKRWRDKGWTAQVIKNEDDEGWAVAMTLHGQSEPALVGPWTMGRDKKNPKPLDVNAFNTLVKTAAEVIRRHEQQRDAQLNKAVTIDGPEGMADIQGPLRVTLTIVPDEYEPHAWLAATDAGGDELARVRVAAEFKLNTRSATAWAEGGFQRPR